MRDLPRNLSRPRGWALPSLVIVSVGALGLAVAAVLAYAVWGLEW